MYAGVMSGIHVMRVVYTTYFDIIYPEDSVELARVLEDRADSLYQKAKETLKAEKDFRIIVVISPDSDSFSVSYSANPYNRIIIYDAVPDNDDMSYEDMILGAFYREVLSAVGQSIKSGFWRFMTDFLGVDSLQPTSLLNLPYSFVKGISSLEAENADTLNDSYNLQLLMQAKTEGRFPSWVDCAGSRDIYPGDQLSEVCGVAFAAWLQQRYGVKKYIEYWHECGKVYFIFFTQTIFKKVYGINLDDAWKEFTASIPVPEVNEDGYLFMKNSASIIPDISKTLPSKLIASPYGIVWYDDLTKEVRIFNPEEPERGASYLFALDFVTKLSCDVSGRFVAVSYEKNKYRSNIKSCATVLYDLKRRRFIREDYKLRDSCIITVNGVYAVAGIYAEDKNSELRVYYSEDINDILYDETRNKIYDDIDDDLIFKRPFSRSIVPYSLTRGPDGTVVSLVKGGTKKILFSVNIKTKEENAFIISEDTLGEKNQLRNSLGFLNTVSEDGSEFSFNYIPQNEISFYRAGWLTVNKNMVPSEIYLQNMDIAGGIYCPNFINSKVYFISKGSFSNQIKFAPEEFLSFEEKEFSAIPVSIEFYEETDPDDVELFSDSDRYNPFRYMFHGTWIPMMPVKEMSVKDGTSMFPGIGVTYFTQSDPLTNNEITFSVGFGFAKLDFQNLVNPTKETLTKFQSQMTEFDDDIVGAVYLKNTTTPVDLVLGSFFKFDWKGQYDFQLMAGTAWDLDLGLSFGNLGFDITTLFNTSTVNKDVTSSSAFDKLFHWPSFFDAYTKFDFNFSIIYSNIHQVGFSPYELSGIKIDSAFTSLWDSEDRDGKKNILLSLFPSFVGFPLLVECKVPRMTPLANDNGWILSVPATIKSGLFYEKGNTFNLDSELLLIGKEVQLGTSILNLFVSRFGLFAGYDLAFDYPLKSDLSPDIRHLTSLQKVVNHSFLNDKFYIRANLVASPVIGKLSKIGMEANFEFVKPVRNPKEFQFNFAMKFNM